MTEKKLEEINEQDLDEICKSIKEGNTSGIISDGEHNTSWILSLDKFKN